MIIAFCVIAFASSGIHGTITTNPILPENKLASNYIGLMLSTQFVLQSSYTGCSWVAQSIGGEIIFHNIARSCFDSSNNVAFVQCTEDNNAIITTTLHITSALNEKTHEFSVRCTASNSAPVTIATRTIMVVDIHKIITTNPFLPENKIATNYVGLMLTSQFQRQSSYSGCSWVAQSIGWEVFFLSILSACMDSSDDVAEVQCTEDGGIITTTLHITSELNGTSEDFSVRCTIINSAPVTVATRTIMIADCFTNPPLIVSSEASATYNSSGIFGCSNNGTLFYANGTQPTSPQTACLATGEWSGQDGLQCWKAPSNVNIDGYFTVLEGNEINLTCTYTPGFPDVTSILFNVNDREYPGRNHRQTLNRNDNRKFVYCQVNNGFTESAPENANNGRSSFYLLNVLYAPFTNASNECNISYETIQDNLECYVDFYCNPYATFVSVTDGTAGGDVNSSENSITIDGASSKHTFKFTDYKVTNVPSSALYNLIVYVPEVSPFNYVIPFYINTYISKSTTSTETVTTPAATTDDEVNTTIIVVAIVLVTVLGTALVVVTSLYWRLRQKHSSMLLVPTASLKLQGRDKKRESQLQWRTQQPTTSAEDPNTYLTMDDQGRAVYEKIGGCHNDENISTSNHHLEESADLNSSTTPYINCHVEQNSQSAKPENDYEMMNAHTMKKD